MALTDEMIRIRIMALEHIIASLLTKQGVPRDLVEEWRKFAAEVKFDDSKVMDSAIKIANILHNDKD